MYRIFFSTILVLLVIISCKTNLKMAAVPVKNHSKRVVLNTPQVVVYKTTKDYSQLVPIIMNAEKTKIISYPAPVDVFFNGKLATPTILKNGYLLDNRGINENVVFTNYTYWTYSQLKEVPTIEELMANIVDKYPLSEMILCGERSNFKNIVVELNDLIDKGFINCKRIEIIPMQINF